MSKRQIVIEGSAKIGKLNIAPLNLSLSPEDLSSPLSLQMALNKILENLANAFEGNVKPHYFAEVKFSDHLGMPVSFAIDLGDKLPPFSKDKVKARIIIELYEDEEEEGNPDVPP
ncbi:hypothetical protein IPA_05160 [Ignicoccus pacificus DSM 13166]|uniref:Uncharacterized protein n=1 Tax=Ignicoccus pacificus DSM 13166 TaxID=940294 RepID=A0A977PK39_9CREN|nr:hypothetical protein IPA_05160 [Ignicoccus pacificus DSM 13166]